MFSKRIIKLSIIAVLFFVSYHSASADITTGLVSHWKLDETSGTVAADSIGTNNGTLINGPTWTTGKVNNALSSDGTDDYVNVADTDALDLATAEATLSVWVKPTSLPNSGELVSILEKYLHTTPAGGSDFCITLES